MFDLVSITVVKIVRAENFSEILTPICFSDQNMI